MERVSAFTRCFVFCLRFDVSFEQQLQQHCEVHVTRQVGARQTNKSRTYIRNPNATTHDSQSSNIRQKGNTDPAHRAHCVHKSRAASRPKRNTSEPHANSLADGTGQRYASIDPVRLLPFCTLSLLPFCTLSRLLHYRVGAAMTPLPLTARPAAVSLPQNHMAEKTSSIKESSRTSSAPAASVSKRLSTSSLSVPSSGAAAPLLAPLTAAG